MEMSQRHFYVSMCVYKCVCVCGVHWATQQQSSLASATHYFMFQAEYHYTNLIDHAAVNAAELMTKTTNAILDPVTGSGCFCSHFRGVCTQPGQRHVPHLEIKRGFYHTTLPFSPSFFLRSS